MASSLSSSLNQLCHLTSSLFRFPVDATSLLYSSVGSSFKRKGHYCAICWRPFNDYVGRVICFQKFVVWK